jgi:hypothetical protein
MNAAASKGAVGALGEIASLLSGTIATSLKFIMNLLTGGFKLVFQFNETAMAFSRQAGLSAKQAQAYTEVLATRAKDLGVKYGIAAEEVTKLEKNLARATGRVMMLSSAEVERQVQINRTVGEDTGNQFMEGIMKTMGGQISTAQGAISKAYALAAKKGLDASNVAAKVGQNLGMANRLTFKNGVDGLTRMVALSEKFGFNMSSLESAADKFMDIQSAIESSASLTMLGGAAGAFGGNPLDMSYEANYDPEAFGERMTKMLGGYAQFDEKTGMAKMNAMSRDFVKGIADAMHISLDEATSIAKRQAEVTYKNNKFGRDLDKYSRDENGNIDENRRDFLLNRTQIVDGKMKMKDMKGEYRDMSYFNSGEGKKELDEMMKFNNMSDTDILAQQATSLKSIEDTLNGIQTSIFGNIAEKIAPHMEQIQNFIGDLYKIIEPHIGEIAENIKELIKSFVEHLPEIKTVLGTILKGFLKLTTFLTSSWAYILGGMFFKPLITWLADFLPFGKSKKTDTGAKGKNKGRPKKSRTLKQVKNDMRLGRKPSNSWWKNNRSSFNTLLRNSKLARGVAKGTGVVGTALAVGEGAYAVYDGEKRKEEIEKNRNLTARQKENEKKKVNRETSESVGGAAGALGGAIAGAKLGGIAGAFGGPLGAAIGAFLGGAIGGGLGYLGGSWAGGKTADQVQGEPEMHADGIKAGAAGGEPPTPAGEKIISWLSDKELTLNKYDQENLATRIEALPYFGEKINTSNRSSLSNVGVKDIHHKGNIDISGKITIVGDGARKDYSIRDLVDNKEFVRLLFSKPEVIAAIENNMNINSNIKPIHDDAWAGGRPSSSSLYGKMTNGFS